MLQESPDQRKQGGGEGDPALFVYWHVHPNKPFVSHLIRALFPKTQRRVNILEQLQCLSVVDGAPETETKRFKLILYVVQIFKFRLWPEVLTYIPLGSKSAHAVMNSPR